MQYAVNWGCVARCNQLVRALASLCVVLMQHVNFGTGFTSPLRSILSSNTDYHLQAVRRDKGKWCSQMIDVQV
jgi:hypothetical protein